MFSLSDHFMSLSTESTGRISREGDSAAADGGPGSGGFGEDSKGGADTHSARHEAATKVLVVPLQHKSQSSLGIQKGYN